jgi:hypothetical protein
MNGGFSTTMGAVLSLAWVALALPARGGSPGVLVDLGEYRAEQQRCSALVETNRQLAVEIAQFKKQIECYESLQLRARRDEPERATAVARVELLLAEPLVEWRMQDGRALVGQWVQHDGKEIQFKVARGRILRVPRERLADADARFVTQLEQFRASGKPAPTDAQSGERVKETP